ncbi:hypothetical protein PoB_002087300 [Plakobranchus ocellatus]|uniref:Uncharacterized protein n=1 Tax=Plakobranchus ocellatus TaxID=259542 RepID=A0AAV3ZHS6_9GAST|nr:hypothetical protein PoB_002087300 [Plakobranchus ocellatus]
MDPSSNVKKTECMVISKKSFNFICNFVSNGETIKQIIQFKTLGYLITSYCRCLGTINRQREKIMDGLATWLGPGKVSDILAAVKDRDLWRDMIAHAYKQGT